MNIRSRIRSIIVLSIILLEGVLFMLLSSSTWSDVVKGGSDFLTGKPINWPIILHAGLWICTLIFILTGLARRFWQSDIQTPTFPPPSDEEDDVDRKIREQLQKLSFLD